MDKLGFPVADVKFMDELRFYRNMTKYYGVILDKDYAGKVLAFTRKMYPNIRVMVSSSLKA